jgi:DNA-binding transcriptional ArsR family regulator
VNAREKNSKAAQHAYEARMVRSAAHPVRAKALSMMAERPTSPKEIAAAVGKPIGNVTYHIRELEEAGMVMLVEEKKRGGATEHFYLATTIDDEASNRLDPGQRDILARTGLHLIIADAAQAVEAGLLSWPGFRSSSTRKAGARSATSTSPPWRPHSRRRLGAPTDSRTVVAASGHWLWRCCLRWPVSPKETNKYLSVTTGFALPQYKRTAAHIRPPSILPA